jgi:hypothetical protein
MLAVTRLTENCPRAAEFKATKASQEATTMELAQRSRRRTAKAPDRSSKFRNTEGEQVAGMNQSLLRLEA